MLKNNLNSINNIRRRDPDATSEEEKLRRHCARMEEEYYTAKSDWETKDNKVKKLNAAAGVLNAAGGNCEDLNTQFANKVTKPIADAGTIAGITLLDGLGEDFMPDLEKEISDYKSAIASVAGKVADLLVVAEPEAEKAKTAMNTANSNRC